MYARIVAGTDFSATAGIATDRAANLARALGAELVLVHAGRDPAGKLAALGRRYGARTLARAGNPAEVLVGECHGAAGDLLVVGSVGMSGAKRFLLGSVPNKVSHHANTDLLIVKTDPPPRAIGDYRRILVGTDGSPTATRAVETAARLAAALDVSPTIVCVYEPLSEAELEALRGDPADPTLQWRAPRSARETPEEFRWRIAASEQAADVLERSAEHASRFGVEAEMRSIRGNPAEALVTEAERGGYDVIVVGSVGMSGPARFMLGNVPHRISHHAPTDVLILHTG